MWKVSKFDENENQKLISELIEIFPINKHTFIKKLLNELLKKLPEDLYSYLKQRDGPAKFLNELPKVFTPEQVSTAESNEQRAWELVGLFYFNQDRFFEALSIFSSLYEYMLIAQNEDSKRTHKGMPLVWMSDCFSRIGFPVHSKRYLMLSLCEDAIRDKGNVSPDTTGVYF